MVARGIRAMIYKSIYGMIRNRTYQDGIFEAKDELHRGALRNGRSVGVHDELHID